MNKRRRYKAKRRRAVNNFWNGPRGRAWWRQHTRDIMEVLSHRFLVPEALNRPYDTEFSEAGIKTTHGRKWIYP